MANQMSLIDDSRVLGREEELKEIIYYLLDCGNNDVGVLPIVGRGGIGKTTLAGLIFDDPSINKHFEIKLWVRVSTDFDVRRLTKSVLESIIDRKSCELMDLDILQNTLRDKLKGRKLLVVFDDVRTENEREWESLLPPFKAGGGGSKIIVTTPSQRVAAITGTFPPYNLEPLQFNDCWWLFKQRAFLDGGDEAPYPDLVPIGMEIVKKCGGLPLAAKILGGALRGETRVSEWEQILESDYLWENVVWESLANGMCAPFTPRNVYLPLNVRKCFMYCLKFPKYYYFDKDNLISLWKKQGFMTPFPGHSLEDTAFKCFDELLLRCYLLQNKANPKEFFMHDLIHDLGHSQPSLMDWVSKNAIFLLLCMLLTLVVMIMAIVMGFFKGVLGRLVGGSSNKWVSKINSLMVEIVVELSSVLANKADPKEFFMHDLIPDLGGSRSRPSLLWWVFKLAILVMKFLLATLLTKIVFIEIFVSIPVVVIVSVFLDEKWVFIIANLVLEIVLVVLDQIASPEKPNYAFAALIVSIVAIAVSLSELYIKARKHHVIFERQGFRLRFR